MQQGGREVFDAMPVDSVIEAMGPSKYKAFRIYESMDPSSRTLSAVAQEAGLTKSTVSYWAKTYNWDRLASSREIEVYKEADQIVKADKVDKIVELRKHYETFIDRLWEQILGGELAIEIKSVKDISSITNDYIKLRGILSPEEREPDAPDQVVNNLAVILGSGASPEQVDRLLNVLETAAGAHPNQNTNGAKKADTERHSAIMDMDSYTMDERVKKVAESLSPENRQKTEESNGISAKSRSFMPKNLENESNLLEIDAEIVE